MAQELADFDLIVIGGGPASIVGATTATQLGKRVALMDTEEELGAATSGTVPSNTMRETALASSGIRSLKVYGVDLSLLRQATVETSILRRLAVRLGCCAIVSVALAVPVLAQTEPIGLERGASCTCDTNPQQSDLSATNPDCRDGEDFRENYLFGDWFGMRCKLAAHGVKPTLFLITDPIGNPFGGRRQGITDYDMIGLDLILETGKLIGWPGGQFHVGFANSAGTDLSAKYVGNSFPIQTSAAGAPAGSRLTYLSYTQALLRDKLSIRFGRLTINSVDGEEFFGSEYFKAFTSVGINLVPLGPFLNAPGAFGYPFGTWGARVKVDPVKWLYVMAGVYNGDPKLKRPAANGVDFSMHGPAFAIGEMGIRWNGNNGTAGLAGNLKIGGYFNGGEFNRFDSGLTGQPQRTVNGVDGFYVLGDQVIRRWGGAKENRHLGVFGSFNDAPNDSVNRVPYFFTTGLVGYGMLPGRARDFAAFGVASGTYSNQLRNVEEMQALTDPSVGIQHSETTLEWTYGATIRPGLVLQPDIQYIINPGGNRRIANAVVMGLHLVISF